MKEGLFKGGKINRANLLLQLADPFVLLLKPANLLLLLLGCILLQIVLCDNSLDDTRFGDTAVAMGEGMNLANSKDGLQTLDVLLQLPQGVMNSVGSGRSLLVCVVNLLELCRALFGYTGRFQFCDSRGQILGGDV